MKAKALLIGCLLAGLTATEAKAMVRPVIVFDDFTNSTNTAANVTVSKITLGTGLQGDNAIGNYSAHSWTLENVIVPSNNDYITITLEANDNYEIDFDSFDFTSKIDSKGPASLAVYYSLDGESSFQQIGSVISPSTTLTTYSIDLSGSQFQNLTDAVTFRLYGYNASNNGGKLSLDSYAFTGTVNSGGTIEAVPEPKTLALLGVGSLLMAGHLRRTRKEGDAVA